MAKRKGRVRDASLLWVRSDCVLGLPAEQVYYPVKEADDVAQVAERIVKQVYDSAQQVPEEITRAANGIDLEVDPVEMDYQTKQVKV